jgi:hypothetical protein
VSAVIPPQVIVEPPPAQRDDRAVREAAGFASGKLRRSESIEWHFHAGGLVLFWFVIIAFLSSALVWLFHLVTPTSLHFLDETQRSNLQNILLAAIGSTAATGYGKRMVKNNDNSN